MSGSRRPSGRLQATAKKLLGLQMETGAWGQRPDSERGNTIATAQVLRVLRWAEIPAWDECVRKAGRHLAATALLHARDIEEGGRGSYVRYVSHSLAGLLEFPDLLADDAVREGRDTQLEWLLDRQTYGGWSDSPRDAISTLMTAQTLQVLRRAGAPAEVVETGAGYLMNARGSRGCWSLDEWSPPSPGVTAECMLALRGLAAGIDSELALPAKWLDTNRRLWLRQVEHLPIAGETWDLGTFAVVERALAPYGHAIVGESGSLDFIDTLWDPGSVGWRFPGETTASPKGAIVAIDCFHAVHASTPLDEVGALLVSPMGASLEDDAAWEIDLLGKPDARVRAQDFERVVPLRPRLWDLLDALQRHDGIGAGGFLDRRQVAETAGMGVKGSLSKEVTRLHEYLAKETQGRVNRVVEPAGRGRWRLTGRVSREETRAPLDSAAPGQTVADAAVD